ncbi:MAG: pyrimidine 5'-nucleotidase [Chloroflexota bacterium]
MNRITLKFLVFDLDNTLYPRGSGVMEEIGRRIQLWLCRERDLTWEQATILRKAYLRQYGTTMGGLMQEGDADMDHYLDFVHDIPIETYLGPDEQLNRMLERIPLRKVVYTNATSAHGRRVLSALGIRSCFERIIGIENVGMRNKFIPEAYERMLALLDASGQECVMVEDSPRNLPPAKAAGMITVLVAQERRDDLVVCDDAVDFVVENVLGVEHVIDRLLSDAGCGACGG